MLTSLGGGDARERVQEIHRTLRGERVSGRGDLRGPTLGLLPIVWVGILRSSSSSGST